MHSASVSSHDWRRSILLRKVVLRSPLGNVLLQGQCMTVLGERTVLLLRLSIALLVAFLAAQAEARRLALVIGNDDYVEQPRLEKAAGDAQAVGAALEALGFEVQVANNLGLDEIDAHVSQFYNQIRQGDIVAFHFSGHGISVNGRNYLIPVDFKSPDAGQDGASWLRRKALDAGEVIDRLSGSGASLVIAILDACRNNPLAKDTRSIGLSRGLDRMDEAPEGVFIFFSAGPGQAALDGLNDTDNESTSVFTRVFTSILNTPDLTLVSIAKQTQSAVRDLARSVGHDQFPDYSDRVIGDVVLKPSDAAPIPDSPPPEPAEPELVPSSETWVAIAYQNYVVSPGTVFGFSGRAAASKEEAIETALRDCKRKAQEQGYAPDCIITGRSEEGYAEPVIKEGCISLFSNVGGTWRFAIASTKGQAELLARSACFDANVRQNMSDPCKKVKSLCAE
jgi:hypothetical protein